jgi:hypothetical protein
MDDNIIVSTMDLMFAAHTQRSEVLGAGQWVGLHRLTYILRVGSCQFKEGQIPD